MDIYRPIKQLYWIICLRNRVGLENLAKVNPAARAWNHERKSIYKCPYGLWIGVAQTR